MWASVSRDAPFGGVLFWNVWSDAGGELLSTQGGPRQRPTCQGGFGVEVESEETTEMIKGLKTSLMQKELVESAQEMIRRDLISLVLNIEPLWSGKSSSAGWDERCWAPFVQRIGHYGTSAALEQVVLPAESFGVEGLGSLHPLFIQGCLGYLVQPFQAATAPPLRVRAQPLLNAGTDHQTGSKNNSHGATQHNLLSCVISLPWNRQPLLTDLWVCWFLLFLLFNPSVPKGSRPSSR